MQQYNTPPKTMMELISYQLTFLSMKTARNNNKNHNNNSIFIHILFLLMRNKQYAYKKKKETSEIFLKYLTKNCIMTVFSKE